VTAPSIAAGVARVRRLLPGPADVVDIRRTWRHDVVAGVTVGVVALPLALAFGITTGLGADAGLVTAVVAGLVAGVFGGSRVQVSGPTGAMTVVLVPIVARYGVDGVLVVSMLAGALLVVAALAGVGRGLAYVPWPVIEGFTLGIAVIIFLQQVPVALGVPRPETDHVLRGAIDSLVDALDHGQLAALGTTLLVVVVMLVVPRLHRALPASLLGVVVATLAAAGLDLGVERIGVLPASLPSPSLPSFAGAGSLTGAAVAVAVLAALESLLSARVADGMSDGPRHDPDRELFGQGLANLASPLFGGMPATGAIARTAVNVRAGARTRLASVVHAATLLGVVYLAGPLVAEIPLAALAGVLMVTAVRMVDVRNVAAVLRSTRSDAAVLVLTAAATVLFDLIVAVEVGLVVAAVLALRKVAVTSGATAEPVARLATGDAVTDDDEAALLSEHIVTYRLDGALFFGASQRFLAELSEVSDVRVVILRLPQLQVLDATGAQALGAIVEDLEHRGTTVLIKGASAEHLRVLRAVGALDHLAHEDHLFSDLDAAIAHAHEHVGGLAHAVTAS
jgi:SulP family sulfate permease